ncbi:MAG: polysaccharide biosynthesis protein [Methanobacteriota archaeon]|nr:MAG: polysaccharide biosynthesis protein [Euryarchaeota archaeon]
MKWRLIKLFQPYLSFVFNKRNLVKLAVDSLIFGFAYWLAFQLRFDFNLPATYSILFKKSLIIAVSSGILANILFRLYYSRFTYASVRDVFSLMIASLIHVLLLVLSLYLFRLHGVPRTVVLIYGMLSFLGLSSVRLSFRLLREVSILPSPSWCRVLIVGAGSAGEMILRQMKQNPEMGYFPVAIVDDDPTTHHTKIHGVPVVGSIKCLPEAVKDYSISEIIIATPSAKPAQMRRIVHLCEQTGVDFKTVPGPKEIVSGNVTLNQIRKVRIEDLLDREPVQVDIFTLEKFVAGKRILVTGAAGSIGSELSRQILRLKPSRLICLDRTENSLFYLDKELSALGKKNSFDIVVGDITDELGLERIFEHYSPDIVFHAAAYKHVPLMEMYPDRAVQNNVFGTLNVLQVASKYRVQKFVLISTDKAVNPTSVMGATKRLAEMIVMAYTEHTNLQGIIVRFGNVLASMGSVVPLFEKQIKNGGPVTVTHPDMKRFFMTIPEAVKLILEAARMGSRNEIFILDMGEPIKIIDFARHMISLSGLEPDKDIPIEIIGMRPGEKLEEELWNAFEKPQPTAHKKIFSAKSEQIYDWARLQVSLESLRQELLLGDVQGIISHLQSLIPEYKPFRRVLEQAMNDSSSHGS